MLATARLRRALFLASPTAWPLLHFFLLDPIDLGARSGLCGARLCIASFSFARGFRIDETFVSSTMGNSMFVDGRSSAGGWSFHDEVQPDSFRRLLVEPLVALPSGLSWRGGDGGNFGDVSVAKPSYP